MLRQSQSSSWPIFWPADDADTQSSTSSPVQPVLDAGKQRRQSAQPRPAVGDSLLRRPDTTSSTTLSPPGIRAPKLLPEKFQIPQQTTPGRDYRSRSVCSGPQAECRTRGSSPTEAVRRVLANRSRSDDGWPPWCRQSDASSRRNSVELTCGGSTLRRSSEPPPSSGPTLSPSSLSRRPSISKYLQQFAGTAGADDGEQKPKPRRRGSVAALIDSFERCALQQQGNVRPARELGDLRAGRRLDRGTFHGSLTHLDAAGRTRRWSNNSEEEEDNTSDEAVPSYDRKDLIFTKPPALTRQLPRVLKSCGNHVRTWKIRDDQTAVDDDASHAVRRSSVDVIRRAFHGSLTNLGSIGRAGTTANNNTRAAITTALRKSLPLTATDHAKVDDEHANRTCRSNSFDVVARRTLYNSDHTVSFSSKPARPTDDSQQKRRLTVIVGTGRIEHCGDSGAKSTPLTTAVQGKASGNFSGTVDQQEANYSREPRGGDAVPGFDGHCGEDSQKASDETGSTAWVGMRARHGHPIANTHCDNASSWAEKLVPTLGTIDDGGGFDSSWRRYDDGTSPRRPRSLTADSNNTEDSGVALSDYTSPVVDCSRTEQNGRDSSRYRPTSGPWMTYGGEENEGWPTPPSLQQHSDTKLAHPGLILHGKRIRVLQT